jgi:hypothetical protein
VNIHGGGVPDVRVVLLQELFYSAVKPEMEMSLDAGIDTSRADHKRFSKTKQPMPEEERDAQQAKKREFLRAVKPVQMYGETAVLVLLNLFELLLGWLAITYRPAADVEWAAGQRRIRSTVEAAIREAFGGTGNSAGKAVAAIRAVTALTDEWRGQLATAAQEQQRHTMAEQQADALTKLMMRGNASASMSTSAAGMGASAAGSGYFSGAPIRPSGGAVSRQFGGRLQTQSRMQRAGIQRDDGCVYWSGRDGSCTRHNCTFSHPAGAAAAAYQKYMQTFGEPAQSAQLPPPQRRA